MDNINFFQRTAAYIVQRYLQHFFMLWKIQFKNISFQVLESSNNINIEMCIQIITII